jgi:hypothetical protein
MPAITGIDEESDWGMFFRRRRKTDVKVKAGRETTEKLRASGRWLVGGGRRMKRGGGEQE